MSAETPATRPLDRALWVALGAVLAVVIGVGAWQLATRPKVERLPVLGTLPDFTLRDQSGREVTADSLRGELWVADFIFTRCSGICPVLSTAMGRLQERLAGGAPGDVKLVTITVDPSHDTPDVLRDYAAGFGADGDRWLFLTGDLRVIYDLVKDGFRLSVAAAPPESGVDEGELVTHSDRLVIVDRDLRVRAYHHGTDEGAVDAVLADLGRLLDRER